MMRVYLNGLQLPVNPMEEMEFSTGADHDAINILQLGDVLHIGTRKLLKIKMKSIFTDRSYPWMAVPRPLTAVAYVNQLLTWLNGRQPIRLIITGAETDINIFCAAEDFTYSIAAAEEGEYYYTLTLTEHREVRAKKVILQSSGTSGTPSAADPIPQRTENVSSPDTYTVRPGDSLWAIAQKVYGNGTRWKDIYNANANKISNPNLIYPNQILTMP